MQKQTSTISEIISLLNEFALEDLPYFMIVLISGAKAKAINRHTNRNAFSNFAHCAQRSGVTKEHREILFLNVPGVCHLYLCMSPWVCRWPQPALGGHSISGRTGMGSRAENPGDTATKSETQLGDTVCLLLEFLWQELNCKLWEQAAQLEGFLDSPCHHSCFQSMLKTSVFSVQLNLGQTTAIESLDHLQCSKNGTVIWVSLSGHKFTLKYVQCVPSQSMVFLWKPSSHGTWGIPHEMLLKADEYTHFIWSLFHHI